jgi:hypothetical protein
MDSLKEYLKILLFLILRVVISPIFILVYFIELLPKWIILSTLYLD